MTAFFFLQKVYLSPEDLAEAAKEATEAAVALALCGTEDGAQHTGKASGIGTTTLLTLAEEGEEARGDGSQDVAYDTATHAALLGDATDDRRQVTTEDVAQDLVTIGKVRDLQVVDDAACVDGMVAEGLGQSGGTAFGGGVLLHGTQQRRKGVGNDRRGLLRGDVELFCDGADGIIARQST